MKNKYFAWIISFCFFFFSLTLHIFADDTRITSGDYVYTDNGDGTVTIVEYTGTAEDLVIPSSIDGKTVAALGPNQSGSSTNYGIQNRDQLRSVRIPGTVKIIGRSFFWNCSELERIEMENGVETVDSDAFSQSYNVQKIIIPSSVKTGGFMKDMRNLRSAGRIGSGLDIELGWTEELPAGTFSSMTLDEVQLPDTITKIGNAAFSSAELNRLHLPSGLQIIGNAAFQTCSCKSGLTIPGSVTESGTGAFGYLRTDSVIIS